MYDGWLAFAGTELVNRARTVALRDALMPALDLGDCTDCYDLRGALDETDSYIPVNSPWYDPDAPGSEGLIGFVANSLNGFEDSTREASVMESTLDGGTVSRVRRKTREMRVSGWLIGDSRAATTAGLSWLKAALDGNPCDSCDDADDLCFFAACPRQGEDADDFVRHLRRTTCVDGPIVLDEHDVSTGGHMVQVEFTLVAGSPFIYGEPLAVASAKGTELTKHLPGAETWPMTKPLANCFAALDAPKAVILVDPDCPRLPSPPTVPSLSSSCKPLTFASYSYPPTKTKVQVSTGQYSANPVIGKKGTQWTIAYQKGTTYALNATTSIKARTSTNGTSWNAEFTAYDDGTANRCVVPAGMCYAPVSGRLIMGVSNQDLAAASGSFARNRGEIVYSTTGSATFTKVSDLDAAMRRHGAYNYYLTDVEHFNNSTPNGVTFAVAHGAKAAGQKNRVFVLRSLDLGATWTVINDSTYSSAVSYTFPQLAIWPNGEMAMLVNVPEKQAIYFRRSADGGKKWTAPSLVVGKAAGTPAPIISDDGTILVMFRDMTTHGARGLGRHKTAYSRNRGRTAWAAGSNVFTGNSPQGQVGADWLPNGTNGDIGVAYALDYSNTDARVYWTTFMQTENYLSYAIGVPETALRMWADGVMMLQIRTGAKPTRQMRVRLIPRPLPNQQPVDLDPCSVCSGFIIDYAPANTLIYVDGMTERVTMKVGNGPVQPADHLVSGENGGLFQWPLFTCGLGYFVLVDVDVNTVVDLALAVADRE